MGSLEGAWMVFKTGDGVARPISFSDSVSDEELLRKGSNWLWLSSAGEGDRRLASTDGWGGEPWW